MNTLQKEKLMQRYLLGDLSDDEQAALELEFFADQEKFEQVWAVENELVDSYVRGRLPHKEHKLFEQHYLQSPKHRERVSMARNLLRVVDEAEAKQPDISTELVEAAKPGLLARLLDAFRLPFLLPVGAMAAAVLLLALGGVWLWNERSQLQDQVAKSQAQRESQLQRERELERRARDLEAQIAAQQGEKDQLTAELEKLRAAQKQLADEQAAQQIAQVTTFDLVTGGTRSGGAVQQLNLSQQSKQVRFRLKVEAGDFQSYAASIRLAGGNEVWSRASISGSRSGGERVISLSVPVANLSTGDYILTLSGTNTAGESEELNRYYFRVNRR